MGTISSRVHMENIKNLRHCLENIMLFQFVIVLFCLHQEYGMTPQEKMAISQGICTPLLKKIRADLQRNIGEEESEENPGESFNRLNPV